MGGSLWYGWDSYDKVSCCFVWKYAQKIAGLQGSTLSDHRMTTGFGPFELPTYKFTVALVCWPHLRHNALAGSETGW